MYLDQSKQADRGKNKGERKSYPQNMSTPLNIEEAEKLWPWGKQLGNLRRERELSLRERETGIASNRHKIT